MNETPIKIEAEDIYLSNMDGFGERVFGAYLGPEMVAVVTKGDLVRVVYKDYDYGREELFGGASNEEIQAAIAETLNK